MAAPVGSSCWNTPEVYKHHEQNKVCASRPKYREGRRDRAVKVYTINLESCFLMVVGVPAIGVMTELVQMCALYGAVEEYRALDEYPAEEFTEVYLIKFQKLTSARAAKRNMDEKSFFGGVLHVCYAPEYETVEDTRLKLQDRRRYVVRTAQNKAREKEKLEEQEKEHTPADTVIPSKTIPSRENRRSNNANSEEESSSSSTRQYLGFPLLAFPPQEHRHHCEVPVYDPLLEGETSRHRAVQYEDKMGSLHNAIYSKHEPTPHLSSSDQGKGTVQRFTKKTAPAVRFVPRITHLENKKRKMVEMKEPSFGLMGTKETLIGPKLPEPPKTDMEDESLNKTANLIRNTLKKVASTPDIKTVEKNNKAKPRRRI
ncbi:RNA-binding protein 48 [Aplochiton taeniatus]